MKISNVEPFSFMHSFPRSCSGLRSNEEIRHACDMLRSFLTTGPLLVPEVVTVPGIEGNEITERDFQILQSRFCLTVYEEKYLCEHMKLFGPISIIFSSASVLRAGAVPVFYFPSFEMGASENALGLSIVHHLRAAVGLIQDLLYLKGIKHEQYQSLIGTKISRSEHSLIHNIAEKFLKSTGRSEGSLRSIIGALQSLSELFYPANRYREINGASLQYFSQREWRILSNMRLGNLETSMPLDRGAKDILLELDYNFFMGELEFGNQNFLRIEETERLEPSISDDILRNITALYCASPLVVEVQSILNDLRIDIEPIPVSLEDL